VWSDKQKAAAIGGPASGFPGPRSSPAVAGGKVVTLGVHGILSCHEAEKGKLLWRKDDFKGSVPGFFASSSPVILDKLCIAQLGGRSGTVAAFDLASGEQKWKWTGDGTAYASPEVLTIGQTKAIVAETSNNLVALSAEGGKQWWKTAYKTRYNASTPMVVGDTLVISGSGKGTKAVKLEKSGEELKATELWNNSEASVIYNTPVIKNGLLYGLSENNRIFCLSMKDGKQAWETKLGGGGGKGRSGYGSIVDAGDVLLALTPAGELLVFEPSEKEYKQLAKYNVGKGTYAYPVASGGRIYVKDAESLIAWAVGSEG
jgi:outer membrane protein assembly factor BamB